MSLSIVLFAGGGGSSVGIEAGTGRQIDIAVNHSPVAIRTHAANHPKTLHLIEDVFAVSPTKACNGEDVDVLWASPDCTFFSNARGGKPVNKKIRGLAWVVVRWAKEVKPRVIFLENVEEFQHWGPLGPDGKPDKKRRGLTFRRFVGNLRAQGYAVEWRVLVAADYGAPTTRKRLYMIARRDGQPINWPAPTHAKPGTGDDLFNAGLKPWRTAAECIDWSIPGKSILDRPKPLAEKTLRRIAAGLERFLFNDPSPFIVGIDNQSSDSGSFWSTGKPLTTIVTENRHAIVSPSIVPLTHGGGESRVYPVNEPAKTITGANRGEVALAAPVLVPRYGERDGQAPRAASVENPMPCVVPTGNGASLVSAHVQKFFGNGVVGREADAPLSTVTAVDHQALAAAFLTKFRGTNVGTKASEPVPTITGQGNHVAEVRAFLVAYYGNDRDGQSLRSPMRTITAKDRLGIVTIHGEDYQIVDITLRMLEPHELLLAMGFPPGYVLLGNKSQRVSMIGNAVSPPVAKALSRANCGWMIEEEVAV